jgi:5-bromo-4-chloroindolyl phosphate hydrolysis protein
MSEQEQLEVLLAQLISMLPSPAYIAISILFGIVGMVCVYISNKHKQSKLQWAGFGLMFYPYLIGNSTSLLIIFGLLLCGLAYFWRKA